MKKLLFVLSVMATYTPFCLATPLPTPVVLPFSVIIASASTIANTQAQVTMSSPTNSGAYSTGYYNYISNVHIDASYTGGTVGATLPLSCTTTNVSGSPSFKFPPALSTGTLQALDTKFLFPVQSTNSASQTSITCPATANVMWNIIVGYFAAP